MSIKKDQTERTPLLQHPGNDEPTGRSPPSAGLSAIDGGETGVDIEDRPLPPFPKFQYFILFCMRTSEPICFTCIFPFVNQMIEELHIAPSPKQVGYYAGVIESLFALAQFTTVIHWGRLSDRYGRKPILLSGLLGASISVTFFGLSRSYAAMMISRSLAGALNGNVAVAKSAIADIVDQRHQPLAFGLLPLGWAIGCVIGPLVGGYLSHPEQRFPGIFGNIEFLRSYPYFLPCFVAALFPLLADVLAFFFLEESLTSIARPKAKAQASDNSVGSDEPIPSVASAPTISSLLTRKFVTIIGASCFIAFINVSLDALIALFCYTSIESGGLGVSPADIGTALGACGFIIVVIQIFVFPPLQRRIGTARTYKFASAFYPFVYLAFPVANLVARGGGEKGRVGAWVVVGVLLLLKSIGNMVYACQNLLVSSCASTKSSLGTLNGILQASNSLMRALGPAVATSLFAVSVEKQLGGGQLIWYVFVGVSVVTWLVALLVEEGEGLSKEERAM